MFELRNSVNTQTNFRIPKAKKELDEANHQYDQQVEFRQSEQEKLDELLVWLKEADPGTDWDGVLENCNS